MPTINAIEQKQALRSGYKFKRQPIIAPALACWLGAIIKHMALMPTAAGTVVFGAGPDHFKVSLGLYMIWDMVIKRRPAGVALILGL